MRSILHADMDAFFAAVEQRDDPTLRGKPVIVGGLSRRGVVSTASYEARRFGVHSAMPTARARALCPLGVFLPPRMEAYAAVSATVQAIFGRFTPLVEPLSLDEAFLDVTASRALFGEGRAIAARIQREVRDATALSVSVGVAPCKFVAKVASDLRKPGGLVVVEPGDEAAFLAPLPVARLWGAGPVMQRRLDALGLRTIGDLAATSLESLTAAIGAAAADHFFALARGVDPREVVPDRDPLSIGRETTFQDDLVDDEAIDRVLRNLCESVAQRLRAEAKCARVVRVKLRFPPFLTHGCQTRVPAALDDELGLLRVARTLLAKGRPTGRPLRLLGVTAAELENRSASPRQLGLFDSPSEDPARVRRLTRAMDELRERFGDRVIRRGALGDAPDD
ncbi:MAG: DNA polymerase IV [Planctomycetes bacterium]|nr:DNA polymerase IV [Planctomycetota bacterium]